MNKKCLLCGKKLKEGNPTTILCGNFCTSIMGHGTFNEDGTIHLNKRATKLLIKLNITPLPSVTLTG